jgi:D-beta-D-heptose 7-phosphate kinase/D-beta-D-heptose 1-phosphate adenosyltransferase
MIRFSPDQLHGRLEAMRRVRIAVLGDLMLDRYLWGSVARISPEAPVPVVEIETESEQFGGAANVANNIIGLGAMALPIGVSGNDGSGRRLSELLKQAGCDTSGLFFDPERPTTIKTRVIANNQHVVRTDRESTQDLSLEMQKRLFEHLTSIIDGIDALLIEDYNKGVIAQPLLRRVIELASRHDKLTTVDPKFNHFLDYHQVTVFKPNRQETEKALGIKLNSPETARQAGATLLAKLNCENVLITLGDRGMMLFERSGAAHEIPTQARRVHDVSGAGDTVIGTLTVALASGASILEAATLANFAAGVVVGEVGAVPIDREKLLAAIRDHQT